MQFKYIGGEGSPGSGETIVYGKYPVEVGGIIDFPPELTDRVRRNPCFVEVAGQGDDSDKAPFFDPAYTTEGEGGKDTIELSKADLIAEAETLGVEIDKRWNAKTIGDKIDAFIKAKREAEGL